MDDKYIFYSKLDKKSSSKKIFRHEIGNFSKEDELIFEEKSEAFTVSIGISSDEKYYFINTSDHNTSEQYYFESNEEKPHPKLIIKREKGFFTTLVHGMVNFIIIQIKMLKTLKLIYAMIWKIKIGKRFCQVRMKF